MKNLKTLGFKHLSREDLRSITGGICKGGVSCDPNGDNSHKCSSACVPKCDGHRCVPKFYGLTAELSA